MRLIKYGCAFVALLYLVYAFVPSRFIVAQHNRAAEILPGWLKRVIDIIYVCFYGSISYGLHKRTEFYWRLIPFLAGSLTLFAYAGAIWSLHQRSMPWVPLIFGFAATAIAFLAFKPRWQNKKKYFSNDQHRNGSVDP